MLIIVGLILSIGASLLTYFFTPLSQMSPWYLLLIIPFIISYFVLYLNLYWFIVLMSILPYRDVEFPGKVNKWCLWHVRLTASFCLTLRGIFVRKKGFKQMPKEPCFIIFNHVCDYDPWVLYKIMGGRYSFVGKHALRNIPMVRCMTSSIGTLYVESNNPERNHKMVDDAVAYITKKETSVVLAPEGTRNTSGVLMPFKHGGFNIPVRSKCPIVLVGFKDMNKTIHKSSLKAVKIHVELFDVIEPKEYEGMTAGETAALCEERYKKYLGEK